MQKLILSFAMTGLLGCTPLPNTGNNVDNPHADKITDVQKSNTKDAATATQSEGMVSNEDKK